MRFSGHDFAPVAASDDQRNDQADRANRHQNPADEIHIEVAHHTGWSTQAELGSAATAWTTYLRGLHAAVEGSASALRVAAETYAASERDAGKALRSGLFPW